MQIRLKNLADILAVYWISIVKLYNQRAWFKSNWAQLFVVGAEHELLALW